jgi:DNA-binding beta-propeller fold protein YncE
MARLLALVASICLLCSAIGPAAFAATLVLERTIPLANVGGRIDHMAIDLARRRLIVAELGNNTVDVLDLVTGRLLHRFRNLKAPQGVAYVAELDLVVVADADDGEVEFLSGSDFSSRGHISLKDDADNVRVDPRSGHVVVGYGNGGLAIIDARRQKTVKDIGLPGHPESFQLDPRSNRAFANVPDAGQIAVVDLDSGRQTAKWIAPNLAENFPMAVDQTGKTIVTVFRSPPRLLILRSENGTITGTVPTCADADDVFIDPKRNRIYVSCGEGVIDIFSLEPAGARHEDRVPTSAGARTSLFVPELDRLYVAARASASASEAAILVFRPD